jgi:hypothetical protein
MSHSNARASDLVKCTDEKGKVIYSDHGCKARDKPASVRIVDSVYDSQSIRDAKARSDQAADSERSKEVEERNLQMVAQNTRNCDAATASVIELFLSDPNVEYSQFYCSRDASANLI